MRLLQRSDTGELSLTRAFDSEEAIPLYAILSHTWLEDAQEPTFEDLTNGTGKEKLGYKKIQFCEEQANRDGLQYFWADTCCINKSNFSELSQAINSMFRWYRNATRCYVYLSDVSAYCINDNLHAQWDLDLDRSRWFTRGWTLQELLAPCSVEFFSCERIRIGDRNSLTKQIQRITGVPASALNGARLSEFSIDERFLWMERRQTKLAVDKVYSLLGILDVNIPLYYDEDAGKASERVREVIEKRKRCIQDLCLTDPRDDKKRIEDTQGGLLRDSYYWILNNSDFQQWRDNYQNSLLWIKGDPGKGKTMLLCGIIDELKKSISKTDLLSYFFCQATHSQLNSATAVLRGLLLMLVYQQPSLVSHIQKKHDIIGKALFEDINAWVAISEIFTGILQDQSLESAYIVIDALDECVTDRPKLLNFIAQISSASSRIKWIVSSRNWSDIEEPLARARDKVGLSLELNAESVSAAVHSYIRHKVLQLAKDKKYSDQTKCAVLDYLHTNANDTFLWVALVCQNLVKMTRFNIVTKIKAFPPGLNPLYERMIQRINGLDDADICRRILAIVAVVYQPITLQEITSLVDELYDMSKDLELVEEIISLCGSLLTIQNRTIYFVHQSAKDFLLKEVSHGIFPSGIREVHYTVFSKSLIAMSNTLRRDMYSISATGYPIDRVQPPNPDPLVALYYSCIYWIDHLYDSELSHSAHAIASVQTFLEKKYLYWLEALSLCKSISKGVVSIAKLQVLLQERTYASTLTELVKDARRFIMSYKWAIENSPLQAYASALLFSPTRSLIRGLFKKEEPDWIIIKPAMEEQWSFCLQTLEGHDLSVNLVAFSDDSTQLASGSIDGTVKIWDVSSGECLQTVKGHGLSANAVWSVAFSHDSTWLASGSIDGTVRIWDVSSGECLQILEGHASSVNSVAFSHDSTWMASGSIDSTVKIWDVSNGKCLQTLEGHDLPVNPVWSVAFSHDSIWLASGSNDGTVKIWDMSSGECLQILEGHASSANSVAFSHDSTWMASGSSDGTVKIWDVSSGKCLQILEGHALSVNSVAFSHDSIWLVSGSDDHTAKIWDVSSGKCLQTLEGHGLSVNSVAFSHHSTWLASGSGDHTVKIWDISSGEGLQTLEGYGSLIISVDFSYDSTWMASGSDNGAVKIWDVSSGKCLQTLEAHDSSVNSVAFSHDSTWMASGSIDSTVKIWDVSSGKCLQAIEAYDPLVYSVAFSYDSTRLASGFYNGSVQVWDISSGECLQRLEGHKSTVRLVAFSHDSTRIESRSDDGIIKIWDVRSGQHLQTLEGHGSWANSVWLVGFSHSSTRLIYFDGYTRLASRLDDRKVYQGLGFSSNRAWITYNSENLLWLPSEYRPSCAIISGNVIGVGTGDGRVWTCKFEHNKLIAS